MLAHLSAAQTALVADGYASVAAAGHGEDAQTHARATLVATLALAASAERQRQNEETLSAITIQLSAIALTKREKRGLVITIPTDFKPGQTDLPSSAQGQYDKLAALLKANPELGIIVQGHADPTGPRRLNVDVSQKRADSVRQWLVKGGVASNKVATMSFGEIPPVDTVAERRVDVILTLPSNGPM